MAVATDPMRAPRNGKAVSMKREPNSPIRIFVVDAEELARDGLHGALAGACDLCLVGEASTIAEATARLQLAEPDVVIVDLDLPDGCGTEVSRFVKDRLPETSVLVLSSAADDAAVVHAIRGGADGFLTKRTRADDLVASVRRLADGRALTDRRHRRRFDELAESAEGDEKLARLTQQEHVLLEHIAEGLTNREIADAMGLSDKTVKNYVSSVMMKLEVAHRAAAAAYYARAEAQLPCSAHANAMGDSVIRY